MRNYVSARQRRQRARMNRLSVFAGFVSLFMIGAGLWMMWRTNGSTMSLKAYGDALGIALGITVMGCLGFAGALLGYEGK